MRRRLDLTNQVFGLLTAVQALEVGAKPRDQSIRWLCRCACGGQRVVSAAKLSAGAVTQCGCLTKRATTQLVDLPPAAQTRVAAREVLHHFLYRYPPPADASFPGEKPVP